MWRTRAVLALLYEEVAGLPRGELEEEPGKPAALERARRRAVLVVAVDWAAILVLVLLGERVPLLTLGPGESTVFTLALLAVAVHSGFRLGQLEKLRTVARAAEGLAASEPRR